MISDIFDKKKYLIKFIILLLGIMGKEKNKYKKINLIRFII